MTLTLAGRWSHGQRWYKLYDKVSPAISLKQRIYLYCQFVCLSIVFFHFAVAILHDHDGTVPLPLPYSIVLHDPYRTALQYRVPKGAATHLTWQVGQVTRGSSDCFMFRIHTDTAFFRFLGGQSVAPCNTLNSLQTPSAKADGIYSSSPYTHKVHSAGSMIQSVLR